MPLIERDALKARLCVDTSIGFYAQGADGSEVCFTSREVDRVIDDAPTIDPVRCARWESGRYNERYEGSYEEQCSECWEWSLEYFKSYCPSCGCKMDGEQHEQ